VGGGELANDCSAIAVGSRQRAKEKSTDRHVLRKLNNACSSCTFLIENPLPVRQRAKDKSTGRHALRELNNACLPCVQLEF
jgi:hypothetical protein